ncbi:hypothetical protein RFI_13473 [Reticulomyxa filosa]|uniref:Uncharacterized protein n=1 Tax=Reticulomyxa filosa TaxID=46433 RepID=X6NED3_RETFI|nr:hypothetical protein RFI_13473 [Reticulomyxa filosa]|eukprot:ETO23707.1 hypothetical protein RFI_13473 [Reticulomyxa filosa]
MSFSWLYQSDSCITCRFFTRCVQSSPSCGHSVGRPGSDEHQYIIKDNNNNDKKKGIVINENQELLDFGRACASDGTISHKNMICFYGKKFNIMQILEDGNALLCLKGKEILCLYQFRTVWFVVYGEIQSRKSAIVNHSNDDTIPTTTNTKIVGLSDAFDQVMRHCWQLLKEANFCCCFYDTLLLDFFFLWSPSSPNFHGNEKFFFSSSHNIEPFLKGVSMLVNALIRSKDKRKFFAFFGWKKTYTFRRFQVYRTLHTSHFLVTDLFFVTLVTVIRSVMLQN